MQGSIRLDSHRSLQIEIHDLQFIVSIQHKNCQTVLYTTDTCTSFLDSVLNAWITGTH